MLIACQYLRINTYIKLTLISSGQNRIDKHDIAKYVIFIIKKSDDFMKNSFSKLDYRK